MDRAIGSSARVRVVPSNGGLSSINTTFLKPDARGGFGLGDYVQDAFDLTICMNSFDGTERKSNERSKWSESQSSESQS